MGVQKVIERAKDLELEPHFPEVLSVSLGAVAVTPLNMTQAYTAFANGGMVSKARFILRPRISGMRPSMSRSPICAMPFPRRTPM